MNFELTDEQRGFSSSLADLLEGASVVEAIRAWSDDDTEPGLGMWKRLADQGVSALIVPEDAGGLGGTPTDLCVAFEQLGRFAVPGPWVESAAYLPVLLRSVVPEVVSSLAEGALGTVHVTEHAAGALDADVAEHGYVVSGPVVSTADTSGGGSTTGDVQRSVDPARRLFTLTAGSSLDVAPEDRAGAFDHAALACSAQLLGLGEQLLSTTVDYVKQRKQFGREIGSYQALKHRLADVRIALDFVRPLVFGASLTFDGPHRTQDVSAAKVAASDAAYLAARTALQLHGAIGYTEEHDLSLWILKVRALVSAWGTPAFHRSRVLEAITRG
jgi:alkylation response protein AidB-like acyl-CoA dehydrogenase